MSASRLSSPAQRPRRASGVVLAVMAGAAVLSFLPRAPRAEAPAERPADDPTTVAWFVSQQGERMHALFDALDLDRAGLEGVRRAVVAGDYSAACNRLLDYYRNARTVHWLRHAPVDANGGVDARGEEILADTYRYYNTEARVPRSRRGGIEWTYSPRGSDPEWAWALNDLSSFNLLMDAYFRTGKHEYLQRIDSDTRDWIIANPFPGRPDDAGCWRGLTTAARARNWVSVFYGLQQATGFSPASRLMMLATIPEHATYLMVFHRRDAFGWTLLELQGLATIGAAWPEFEDATGWRAFALERLGHEMAGHVYPDGVQVELAVGGHRDTVEQVEHLSGVLHRFGYTLPDSMDACVQKMWNYLALTMRPDGTTPGNNDSDARDVRSALLEAARRHDRADWMYVVTDGKSGTPPAEGPSVTFPWAGQSVMRSGWKPDAQWSFFDAGPYGTNHPHRDMLHVSIDAYGRALLVDGGRYTYAAGKYRDYFTGTASHNTIRIDGADQRPYARRAEKPLRAVDYGNDPRWDYARGIFEGGYEGVAGEAVHTRALVYVRDRFWVVADRVETDRPRTVQALWHFAPDCTVVQQDRSVTSTDAGKGNLRVIPVGGMRWKVEMVSGEERPVQGWYSGVYGEKVPAPAAVYTAELPGTTTFTWLLVPGRGEPMSPVATVVSSRPERVELRVQVDPKESYLVTVPMNGWRPMVRRE